MENKEKTTQENIFAEKCYDTSCRSGKHISEMMSKCCKDMSNGTDCFSMMGNCMRKCRWFLLIPVTIGILLLLLGFVLNAEVTRILWISAAGFVIFMGIFIFLVMSLSKKA